MLISKKYLFENFVSRKEYEEDKKFIANKLFELLPEDEKWKKSLDLLKRTNNEFYKEVKKK